MFVKKMSTRGKLILGSAIVAFVVACALTGGATNFIGQLVVQSSTTAPTCGTATSDGDLCVADAIEANGALDIGGAATLTGAVTLGAGITLVDDADIVLGTGSDFLISFDATTQAPDSAFIGVGTESRQLVIGETADVGTDLTIAQQTNPTLNIHSADATDANDYITLAHDQTNGVIDVGQGTVSIPDGIITVDNSDIVLGTGSDFGITFDAVTQAPDSAFIGVGSESRQLVIAEWADVGTDLTGAQSTDPELRIHSADATDANDFITIEHNQTNGVIDVGQGVVSIPDGVSLLADDVQMCLGASTDACFEFETAQTTDALTLGLDSTSRSLIIQDIADIATDYTHGAQTNPTVYVHSADETTVTDFISLAHDQTNGVLDVGGGIVSIPDGLTVLSDDTQICIGAATDACFEWDTGQTEDSLILGLDSTSRNLTIIDIADIATDYTHAASTDPTLFVQSADETSVADFISLSHNQTNGVIDVGAGIVSIPDGLTVLADDAQICLGASTDACLEWETAQTVDTLYLGVDGTSRSVLMGELADIATDFGHTAQTNPTLWIHSADATDTADYIGIAHDQSNVYFQTGRGGYQFTSSNGKGSSTQILTKTESVTFPGGGAATQVTTGSIIPDGAFVVAVTTRVTTTATTCTDVDIGIAGTDTDCYADGTAVAATTTTTNADGNSGDTCGAVTDPSRGAQEITVTANGGNCVDGVWAITVHYLDGTAATAN